jgi:hypothetical protein
VPTPSQAPPRIVRPPVTPAPTVTITASPSPTWNPCSVLGCPAPPTATPSPTPTPSATETRPWCRRHPHRPRCRRLLPDIPDIFEAH